MSVIEMDWERVLPAPARAPVVKTSCCPCPLPCSYFIWGYLSLPCPALIQFFFLSQKYDNINLNYRTKL